ncbi:hypothetical protein ACGE24_07975 [Corynebacterium kroppenstedtii]|uniref:hypothetical protein n=1 Tax=Corynebacterium sp. PCR 32 TaxID=3351342 RepID=UPI00309DEA8B
MSTSPSSHRAGDHPAGFPEDHYTQDPAYISQRRTLIRRYHPDRGGDADLFIRKLDELNRDWAQRHSSAHAPESAGAHWDRAQDIARRHTNDGGHLDPGAAAAAAVIVSAPTAKRVVTRVRRAATATSHAVRTRLPRGMPGAVRYASTSTRPGHTPKKT